ncbi:alpha/beta hydrolase [Variovorax sp. M-6]|uniref:alpha/beta hydrolase n=1 Tax=Variovorax sp. M-6 TaxID=3233041 RepID=UPI003F94CC75
MDFEPADLPVLPPVDPTLESEYALRSRHPERNAVYERQARASADLRRGMQGLQTRRYAEPKGCLLDFLPAPQPATAAAPLFVFIHGGYWRALDRGIFTFLAAPWLELGIHAAFIGYDLAPALRVSDIVAEIGEAMAWLRGHAQELGVDSARMLVAGHSAGAQLGACVLDGPQGWQAAAFVGVSGVYDLEPLRHTSINADIRLDEREARAISPMAWPAERSTKHLLVVGGAETEGFRGQSIDYAEHLRRAGCAAALRIVPERTHFDILDDLGDGSNALFRDAYALLDSQ